MEQTAPTVPADDQTNKGLDHSKCLNCQRNPPNPAIAGMGTGRGILCRKCQSGVLTALRSHERPEDAAARIARIKAEQLAREARAAKNQNLEPELYH